MKLPSSGDVPYLLEELLAEINQGPKDTPVIEWAAKTHAKFEAIHPYSDGNGRTGRLLGALLKKGN